jgi:hydroxyacylglutathione hydrolase
VLTGDALFLGDVGRPDLLTSSGWTADQLARLLYRSLRTRLLTLPDTTRVYRDDGARPRPSLRRTCLSRAFAARGGR